MPVPPMRTKATSPETLARTAQGVGDDASPLVPPAGQTSTNRITASGLGQVSGINAASSVQAEPASEPPAARRGESGGKRGRSPTDGGFAPLSAPRHDLGAGNTRRTLVGISAPLPPEPAAAVPAESPPRPSQAELARAEHPRTEPRPVAIEASPLKRIEVSANGTAAGAGPHGSNDPGGPVQRADPTLPLGVAGSAAAVPKRPAHATVPFPRPRLPLARPASASGTAGPNDTPMPEPSAPVLARSPTETLRFVLTSPDHKPQRVAGAVVCAAAAIVIFATLRSPVTGTESIGETTGSLSLEPAGGDAAERDPLLAPPTVPGDKAADATGEPDDDPLAEVQPKLAGQELAPGLVVPSAEGEANARKNDKAEGKSSNADGSTASGGPNAPALTTPSTPKSKPRRRTAKPTRKRRSTDFDFGI
jgi:hypothetical protein